MVKSWQKYSRNVNIQIDKFDDTENEMELTITSSVKPNFYFNAHLSVSEIKELIKFLKSEIKRISKDSI